MGKPAKKAAWAKRIKKACEDAGTWKDCFSQTAETLADILEKRDAAQAVWEADGAEVLVTYTNKGGAENQAIHPALKLVTDLNRDALTYLRDLGLTPAGLRKINEDAMRPRKASALADALRQS